jgi:phosphoglycolate phosphatase
VKLIAIDLDGTLEDSRDDMVAAARRVRAQLGLPPRADEQLRPHVNAGMDQLYRACFDDHLERDPARIAEVRSAYEADYLANVVVHTRLYDGIAPALAALAELGALCCVTNKPERISRRLLDELGVGALFQTVVGGDSCAEIKPSPLMLRTAATRCGYDAMVPGARSFMIGDTAADLQLARSYGATAVWCAWGYASAAPAEPDAIARVPADLARIVAAG